MPRRESPHTHGRSEIWTRSEVVEAYETYRVNLAERLRAYRQRAGLSQEALAERSGVHAKHIQRIERCKCNPKLATLVALAVGLGIEVRTLLR